MATEIIEALVLPTGYLSVAVRATGVDYDGFRITATDGVTTLDETQTLVNGAGYEAVSDVAFVPRVFRLVHNNDNYIVTAQPTLTGTLVGDVSSSVLVWPVPLAAPEIIIRQLVCDKLSESPIPLVYDTEEAVWVNQDRMGRPKTTQKLIGKPGATVEVGIPYMSAEDPFSNSTDTDTQITVPVRVLVKGDNSERGEDAVNAAYLVRGALSHGLDMNGFGITKWTWSGSEPAADGVNIIVVNMSISLTRVASEWCQTPVLDGNTDDVADFVMDGGEE